MRHIDQITLAKKENDKCTLINSDVPKIQFIGGGTYTYGALMEAQVKRIHLSTTLDAINPPLSLENLPILEKAQQESDISDN